MRFNKNKLLLYFVMIPFMKPYFATIFPPVNVVFYVWKFLAMLFMLQCFFTHGCKISKFTLCGILFCSVWSISMLLNVGTMGNSLQEVLSIIVLCLFCDTFALERRYVGNFLQVVANIGKVLILCNTITVFFNGIIVKFVHDPYPFFLGGDNYFAFILIPLSGILFANDLFTGSTISKKTWCYAFMGFFSLLYKLAFTGFFAYGVFIVGVMLLRYQFARQLFTLKNIVLATGLFLLLQLCFNISANLEPVLSLIGKSGLNSRDIIWSRAVECIKMKPFLGYGFLRENQIMSGMLFGAGHAHNIFLEYLLNTGIIGSIIALIWYRQIFRNVKDVYTIPCLKVLIFCICSFWICSVFDFYMGLIYYYILLLVIYMVKGVLLGEITEKLERPGVKKKGLIDQLFLLVRNKSKGI